MQHELNRAPIPHPDSILMILLSSPKTPIINRVEDRIMIYLQARALFTENTHTFEYFLFLSGSTDFIARQHFLLVPKLT